MPRMVRVGAAQLGPLQRRDSRAVAVSRMLALLGEAKDRGCDLVVYPELALTTFFPRWDMHSDAEIDAWFESEMPGSSTQPLFDAARTHGIGISFGYAERVRVGGRIRRYNTSILVDKCGAIVGRYRKTHLPGYAAFQPSLAFQHLEKKYFDVGDTGFRVWKTMGGLFGMCICNDRRWPESFRVLGLQGVEMVLVGFNTPRTNFDDPDEDEALRAFQNDLCVQAGAYQNGTWVVAVAKAGTEDGHDLVGGTVVVHPSGAIVARSASLDDELVVADCDLDTCGFYKETIFDFASHRRIEHYGPITTQTGIVRPDDG